MLADIDAVHDLSVTTNGFLLERDAEALVRAGINRFNVSVDSLQRDRFFELTRRDALPQVLRGLERLAAFPEAHPIKINAVAIRGFTEDEVIPFAEFARRTPYEVRFIEFMPLDADHAWTEDQVLTGAEIRERDRRRVPARARRRASPTPPRACTGSPTDTGRSASSTPCPSRSAAIATASGLTADGRLRTCLFSLNETDLRGPLRDGADDHELEQIIRDAVWLKELKHHVGEPGFIQPTRSMSAIGELTGVLATLQPASSRAQMLLLMLFALIAGAGTAITPCVLPVVPALLASSATGGRRRPIGIVIGLGVTFTIAIVLLAQLVKGVGLASGAARTLAIVVLIVFGIALLIPDVTARVEAPLSRLGRFGPKTRGTGFWSGLGVGAALGFVCAPCAGPILAAVTSVSASSGANARVVARRDLLRGRAVRRTARVRLRRARGDRPGPPRRARQHRQPRPRRRAAGDRGPDGVQRRRPVRGGARQGREPPGDPGRSNAVARELERGPEPPRVAAPGVPVRDRSEGGLHGAGGDRNFGRRARGGDPGRQDTGAARPRDRSRIHRQPGLVQHPGRPAADRWPGSAATSCSSTSGPTRASTACARCRS